MSEPDIHHITAAARARDTELAWELHGIEKRDWWMWGYTIVVMLVLTFGIISLALPAVRQGAETVFRVRLVEAISGLIGFVLLLNIYTIYQQVLIKRLRRQLAERQSHADILRNLAMMDPLTGLYNRRFAEHRLAAEVARSERKGHPLTVLTLDLNNFKKINDTYGHPAGDKVLQEFAARLNKVIRGADLAVRLGGDEFLVLLPECTLEQLQLVLGRLGSVEVDWEGQEISVTYSAGWKQYELGDRPEEMLARADQNLYASKRAGKNTGPKGETRETEPAPLHVLIDVTCPHCRKANSVAVSTHSGGRDVDRQEVQCAHCKNTWSPAVSGPIMAGPFPK